MNDFNLTAAQLHFLAGISVFTLSITLISATIILDVYTKVSSNLSILTKSSDI